MSKNTNLVNPRSCVPESTPALNFSRQSKFHAVEFPANSGCGICEWLRVDIDRCCASHGWPSIFSLICAHTRFWSCPVPPLITSPPGRLIGKAMLLRACQLGTHFILRYHSTANTGQDERQILRYSATILLGKQGC